MWGNTSMIQFIKVIRKRTENWIDFIPKKAKRMRQRLTNKRVRQFLRKDENK